MSQRDPVTLPIRPIAKPSAGRLAIVGLTLAIGLSLTASHAFALSEIKREELPAPDMPAVPDNPGQDKVVPIPDPIAPHDATEPDETGPVGPDGGVKSPAATNPVDENEPVPQVEYDFGKLPAEVKRMRDLILAACLSGDPEALRPLIGMGDAQTQISLAEIEGDPIAYLKSLAGDEGGQEILAILEEVLSAGYVHLDAGTPSELYVWPYFFAMPIDKLTAPQRVELFKIVTAGDYEEMKNYGSYIFYRVGIAPDGRWSFFVAGE